MNHFGGRRSTLWPLYAISGWLWRLTAFHFLNNCWDIKLELSMCRLLYPQEYHLSFLPRFTRKPSVPFPVIGCYWDPWNDPRLVFHYFFLELETIYNIKNIFFGVYENLGHQDKIRIWKKHDPGSTPQARKILKKQFVFTTGSGQKKIQHGRARKK